MNKYVMGSMLIGMLGALVLFFLGDVPEPPPNDEPAQPLEGTLYTGRVEEIEKSGSPLSGLPQITIPESDSIRLGLGEAKVYLLKVVPDSTAKYRLLAKGNGHKKPKIELAVLKSTTTLPSPGADSPPAPAYSFKFFDAILESSESSYVLSNRYIKGGVTFEAVMVCRWRDLCLLKFRITNDEEHEFFVARVDVRAEDEPLKAKSYLPFSCRSFGSTEGIVTFPAGDVKKKKVSLILVEGGDRGRTYPIDSVDYDF